MGGGGRRRICESSVSRHLQRFFPCWQWTLLAMAGMDPPYSVSDWLTLVSKPAPVRAVSYFLYDREKNKKYSVSFDRTDKNKLSFETAKGILLFLYSHNSNEIMCFSKINKINRVRSLPALSLSPFFTDT